MHWSKIAVFLCLLTIIFTVGEFGSHFGYSVHGVPVGKPLTAVPDNPSNPNTTYTVYFQDGTTQDMTMAEIQKSLNSKPSALGYLGALATFSIDGMPAWMTFVFYLFILGALYIVISIWLPGGGD